MGAGMTNARHRFLLFTPRSTMGPAAAAAAAAASTCCTRDETHFFCLKLNFASLNIGKYWISRCNA